MRKSRVTIMHIIIAVFAIIVVCTISYRYNHNKYKDLNYAAQTYITTGLFNKYKMYKIDKMDVSFSDGTLAIISVTGPQDKAPHKNVNYKIFLEKRKSGIWKVKKVYME